MYVSIKTSYFCVYTFGFVSVVRTIEHIEHVIFSCMDICNALYRVKLIHIKKVLSYLLDYLAGITWLINLEQHCNTHFHIFKACLSDVTRHIFAMGMFIYDLCIWLTCGITQFLWVLIIQLFISLDLLFWLFLLWSFSFFR